MSQNRTASFRNRHVKFFVFLALNKTNFKYQKETNKQYSSVQNTTFDTQIMFWIKEKIDLPRDLCIFISLFTEGVFFPFFCYGLFSLLVQKEFDILDEKVLPK